MAEVLSFVFECLEDKGDATSEVELYCDEPGKIFIDDETRCAHVEPGRHLMSVRRHRDFFFDWAMDGKTVEEFLVFDLLSDGKSSLLFQTTTPVKFDGLGGSRMKMTTSTKLPVSFPGASAIELTITCEKPSQLSIYFDPRGENYRSITLFFNQEYCNVFMDQIVDGKYRAELRKNMSLFKTRVGIANAMTIDLAAREMRVRNEAGDKSYDISEIGLAAFDGLEIRETYAPNGPGQYLIRAVNP